MEGKLSASKRISTTGPMTCTIFPVLLIVYLLSLHGTGTADNLGDLLCDCGLSSLVVLQLQ
jgi:hypothetical protein